MPPPPRRWPLQPRHPERVCWGCERLCPADALACGNGSERAAHPAELFGPDWQQWAASRATPPVSPPPPDSGPVPG